MEHCLNFEYILDTMSNNYGLAGIFANYGFGTTTLMMQIIDEINKRKDGIAIVMSNEFFKEYWIKRMKRMNLSTERVVVYDKAYVTHSDIFNALSADRGRKKVSMVCVDYIDLMQKRKHM
jgi:predicted ATP-dependent serine protease